MDPLAASCPDRCNAYEPGDNYCRRCGMYVAEPEVVDEEERTVTVVESRRPRRELQAHRPGLPVPSTKVATAVAVGTAVQLGVALLARYMAGSSPRPAPRRGIARNVAPQQAVEAREVEKSPAPVMEDNVVAVIESVTFRRTWLRKQ